tara:strand:- start:193 stop:366 length:174 start_codon:yes stop_codon:yes gene_type:complete
MNNKKSKQIRKLILNTNDEISRRNYRRFKKQYKSLSGPAREEFLKTTEEFFKSLGEE